MNNFDAIIIGGGIIGTSCAYELSKNGAKVAILEKRHIGSGASGSSAAMLEYQVDAYRGEAFLSLAAPSIRLFPTLSQELKELTGVDFGYENCGILQLAFSEEEATILENETIRQNYWKRKCRWLSQEDVIDIYPQLTHENFGAAFFEEDGQVVGERFTTAMARGALLKGANFYEEAIITGFEKNETEILSVQTNKGILSAPKFVLAAGAWSDDVLALLGIKIGIEPVRGQLLVYDTPRQPVEHPIFSKSNGYLAPKKDGYTLVGTTVEKVGFEESTTDEARQNLISKAQQILPRLARMKIRGMIAGLRPGSPDELPIIGALPQFPNLLMAAGHFRNGILLAQITAQIISNLILEKPLPVNISSYSPFRFLIPSSSSSSSSS